MAEMHLELGFCNISTCVLCMMIIQEKRYDATRNMGLLVEDFVSRANSKQRKGRAGRVKPGRCFCLYTSHRFENLMRGFQVSIYTDRK